MPSKRPPTREGSSHREATAGVASIFARLEQRAAQEAALHAEALELLRQFEESFPPGGRDSGSSDDSSSQSSSLS